MEFWGVEVKAGQTLKVKPELFKLIHVSQAAIGEVKDPKEVKNVALRVTVGENNYVIGALSAEDRPQLMFDLVFEKEFELSHGWKDGSVYFMGYMADDPMIEEVDPDDESDDEEEEEEIDLDALGNGDKKIDVKPDVKKVKAEDDVKPDVKKAKPASSEPKKEVESDDVKKAKANIKVAEPKKEEASEDDSEDDSDDEDESDDEDVSSDEDGPVGMDFDGPDSEDDDDDDDESDEDEDSSEEETPKKSEQKKRPASFAAPGSAKKAKQATPVKTPGGKKGPATPASAKQNGKPSFNGSNKKGQSPKSGGGYGSQQNKFKGKQGRK